MKVPLGHPSGGVSQDVWVSNSKEKFIKIKYGLIYSQCCTLSGRVPRLKKGTIRDTEDVARTDVWKHGAQQHVLGGHLSPE